MELNAFKAVCCMQCDFAVRKQLRVSENDQMLYVNTNHVFCITTVVFKAPYMSREGTES